MKITLTSVIVDNKKRRSPSTPTCWGSRKRPTSRRASVRGSPWCPRTTPLVLEPDAHPAAKPFKDALVADGIPYTSFAVNDVHAEYQRLSSQGVVFTQAPLTMGRVTTAVFDDTCGNLIQIAAYATLAQSNRWFHST